MNNTLWFLVAFLAVDVVALAGLLIAKLAKEARRNRIRHFGDEAEKRVIRYLQDNFPDARILNNCYFRTRNSLTQIDHVLLCKWGIYVIETKSHNGKIRTEGREWIQFYGDKVVRFHSPILQNARHREAIVKILQRRSAFRNLPVKSLVVFTSRKVFFTKPQDGVLRLEELGPYIKNGDRLPRKKQAITAKTGRVYLSKQKIASLEKLLKKYSKLNRKYRRSHEKSVRALDRNR